MRLLPSKRVIYDLARDAKYLTRWTLFEVFGWSLKVHCFHRGDDDRDLHDHPWSFWSLILRGGYWEHTQEPCRKSATGLHDFSPTLGGMHSERCGLCDIHKGMTSHRWYGPDSILRRPAPWPHRIELNPGTEGKVWTLVLTAPKTREWGFSTVCGWIPWLKYSDAKADGC